ncbi:MAG: futalosine hydrolase [Aureispira sp.]|nr:futalosine hydrolase [Aureispira sp.]
MNILIVAATKFEILPLLKYLQDNFKQENDSPIFKKDKIEVFVLITGVGMMHTAFALGNYLGKRPVDLAINVGIAGAYDRSLEIGEVVHVVSEQLGDLGVEEQDGSFKDVFEMGLIGSNDQPFINGKIYNPGASAYKFLKGVDGLTVNRTHGTQESIDFTQAKYSAQIETMEGAAFFYACGMVKANFLQLRAISNYVEPRNKDNWKIPLAIDNVNTAVVQIFEELILE